MLRRVAPAAAFGGLILFGLTAHLLAGTKTVEKPMFNGHRLGWCANWGADCGEPAAEAWCIAQGFAGTANFTKAPKIGDKSPTRLIATGAVCDAPDCDGFKEITCLELDTVQPEPAEDIAAAPSPPADAPAAAADSPAPAPEPLPTPETTAATSPAAPVSQTIEVAEIPGDPEAEVRVITPASAPRQAAASDPPAVVQPISATATMEATDEPGPPPPETAVLAAAGAPPLRPVLEVFDEPTFNGRRLDWCRGWKDRCGKATADEFCQLNGFVEALSFAPDPKIGAIEPTRQIASGLVCDHDGCDGFAEIACTK